MITLSKSGIKNPITASLILLFVALAFRLRVITICSIGALWLSRQSLSKSLTFVR